MGQRTAKTPIDLVVDELPRLGDGVEREIIGIAQEALTNAVRHSRARRITITASAVQSVGLRLSVADDGRGIARDAMRHRIRHDQHAGARRADRRLADDRHGAAEWHRSRAGLGAGFAADAGACCQLKPRRRGTSAWRACSSSTITRCCAPASPTSSTRSPTCSVVAEAGNGRRSDRRLRAAPSRRDAARPAHAGDGGVEAVRRIRERDPQARVIILTTYDTDEEISRALKAGAKAYVLKDISADDLISCIRDVLSGKTYLAPAAAAKLAEGVTRVQLTPARDGDAEAPR